MLSRRNNCATIVLSALQAIGYAEIALRLDAVAPPFELSLSDLAEEAGPGYELAFFPTADKNAFNLPSAIALRVLISTGCNRACGTCNR